MIDLSLSPLQEKRRRQLFKLLKAEGIEPDETWMPDDDLRHWDRYQLMTKVERDRLFTKAAQMKNKRVPAPVAEPLVPNDPPLRRGRGPGKVKAKEAFTFLISSDLIEEYRQLADRRQRPVAELIRLAMRSYLESGE